MANPRDYCYIIILPDPDDNDAASLKAPIKIRFDTMPASITDAKMAVWQDTAIIARSAPLKTYQFSGARTISFALDFFVSISQNDIPEGQEITELLAMKEKLNQLRALMYPNSNISMARPRKCILRIGEAFGMLAFCKQVSIIYRGDSPWEVDPMMAHHATVNLLLEETGENLYSFSDIILDQDFTDIAALTQSVSGTVSATSSAGGII